MVCMSNYDAERGLNYDANYDANYKTISSQQHQHEHLDAFAIDAADSRSLRWPKRNAIVRRDQGEA